MLTATFQPFLLQAQALGLYACERTWMQLLLHLNVYVGSCA